MNNVRPGDVVAIQLALYVHVGIFWGFAADGTAWVIHNSKEYGKVVASPFAQFTGGRAWWISRRADDLSRGYIVDRAKRARGTPYSLASFNCEDFVAHCFGETPRSQQREAAGILLALVGGIAGLATIAANAPRYDPQVDRHRNRRGQFASSWL